MPGTFDWRDYVRLSDWLRTQAATHEEARLRSTISRAYYGAYHVAKAYILRVHQRNVSKDHGLVWSCLQERARSDDEKEAGNLGNRIGGFRRDADYRTVGNLEKTAAQAVAEARKVCELLGQSV